MALPQTVSVRSGAARRPAELPGPRPSTLFGHLLQFDLPRLHLQLEDWARTYGPAYRLQFGRRDAVVVSETDAILQALRARPQTWRRLSSLEKVLHEARIRGVFSAEGQAWRRQRRIVMAALDPGHLRRFFPALQRVTGRLQQHWMQAAREGRRFDLQAELMRYTVDVTAGLAFGVDMNTIEQQHSELHAHLDQVFPTIFRRLNSPLAYWRVLRLPRDREFDRHIDGVHRVVRQLMDAARHRLEARGGAATEPADLLEALLLARDDEGRPMPEDEVAGNVFTMLLAGEDTTANSLAWTLYLLHTHPAAWQRLVEEADSVLAPATLPGRIEDAAALPWAEACVNEAMRLHPVAPLNELEACEDTRLGDLLLPRGTLLFCLTRMGAVDERQLEHGSDFRPERWLASDPPAAGASPKRLSMPFGAGPRLCPGRYLAMLEMRMLLGMLARNFELAEVGTADGLPPREQMAFAMRPVGLQMRLAPRQWH
ncbi:cytochrome P450 [Eleftheria terrae]|uniref:cytochrome P450 n=1 Tax=Eleftheria terrae TaxID=1597781 RepID=UPI00263AB755|nr:cytochrome P450 [Eleftheria terrae]WKB53133.1 cytochrome P450 [Eleftheria terrae]